MLEHGKHLIRLHARSDTPYVSQGRTVLVTERDGFIDGGAERGLFVYETRLLSRYRYLIDGQVPLPVALSNVDQHTWLGYYVIEPPGIKTDFKDTGSGLMVDVTEETLELRLSRYAGGGVHEDVDLTNFCQQRTEFRLEIDLDADFTDLAETRGERIQTGELTKQWREAGGRWELAFDYRATHEYDHQGESGVANLHRGITVRVAQSDSEPHYENGSIVFPVRLDALGKWHACIELVPCIDGDVLTCRYRCCSFDSCDNDYDNVRNIFLRESTSFASDESRTLAPVVMGALEQATLDLAALRLYDLDEGERAWTVAAGLPIFVALFGRDTLTASWQAAIAGPELMNGTLPVLARLQGTEVNEWRDEEPGKMLHEAHTGPLEMLEYNPRRRYYGSLTTSGFYPVIVSELWHWTGDKDLIRPLIEPALECLRWRDEFADLNGDGFYEYKTRSSQGVKHQGWKDSPDAIVYEDGSQVEPPIAPCEEQAFVYAAKLQMSEILWWFDEKERAKRLYHEAGEFKKRFNEAFWMEAEHFFAMGLDADDRPIKSISSNPGHCIATGIVDKDLVAETAERLLAPDLFTGWGIRTLSDQNPAYNPYSYHRGSVWPVEHGTFALGFMRYGLHESVEKICRAQFEAAALFDYYRLPELFSGHQRDEAHPFPALYIEANSPQAWSASSVFCLVQAMLGLYPYAPLNLLLVDPHLPEWLPEITVRGLRVGKAVTTIHFYRKENGKSDYKVLDTEGTLHVVRQPSPWSLTASFAERLIDALKSLLPGK